MSPNKHFGIVSEGCLIYHDPMKLKTKIDKLEGCRFELTLSKEKKIRSNKQNKYYWYILLKHVKEALTESQGVVFTLDDAHDFMKHKFIGFKKIKVGRTHITKKPTTKDLSTVETNLYYKNIRDWLFIYFEVLAPLPNEDLS